MMGSSKNQAIGHLVHNTSFSGVYGEIDNLTNISDNEYAYIGALKEITRQHWKPPGARCSNTSCRKQFSPLLERPHHCHRCGEVFCRSCVAFLRRLNKLAKPDPDGELYKVCKSCFDLGKLTDGQKRDHKREFEDWRRRFKEGTAGGSPTFELSSVWRSKMNFDRERQRLLNGFGQSVGNSEIKRTLHEMRSFVSTPDWMKSSVWIRENFATRCQVCQESFGMSKKKQFCCVCGQCVCKACSTKDLLLYIPDEDRKNRESWQPKMTIIKIIGCPEVEPQISIYLRVCLSCKDKLEDRQVKAQVEDVENLPAGSEFMDILLKLDENFHKAETQVRTQLPEYLEIVESLEDSSRRSGAQNNTKVLAKAQKDLADVLAQHVTTVQQLKKLKPQTDTQTSLLKTYIRAKCQFYLDQMSSFRTVTHKLSESVPPESLDFIQRIMDKRAIIDTHLYLRQLVYETIHLCGKHKMQDDMPAFLMEVEQKVDADLQACLQRENEDVKEHMGHVTEMIKALIEEKRLIRPSNSQLKSQGCKYLNHFMSVRVEHILNQLNNQLCLASANRSFQGSKMALSIALKALNQKRLKDKEEKCDFVFVDKEFDL